MGSAICLHSEKAEMGMYKSTIKSRRNQIGCKYTFREGSKVHIIHIHSGANSMGFTATFISYSTYTRHCWRAIGCPASYYIRVHQWSF